MPVITAFRLPNSSVYPEIVPAPASRVWMDEGTKGWANRCLPLRIANANGWFVLNPAAVEIEWTGTRVLESIRIKPLESGGPAHLARSMFGFGIVTFVIPYLFRTPQGVNLVARGPVNQPKDAIAPLEGIVETDWLPFTFTMNWQVTRPGTRIRFERGEPIAMLTPSRRGETASFEPEIRNLESDAELLGKYETWLADRRRAQQQTEVSQYQVQARQGHYIRGEDHQGLRAAEHETRLEVRKFEEREPAPAVVEMERAEAGGGEGKSGWMGRLFGRRG